MKSISPVVATIILIVMLVAIASTVFLWISGYFQNLLTQTGEQVKAVQDVSLLQINYVSWYDYRDGLILELTFDNIKLIKQWKYPNFEGFTCNPSCKTTCCGSLGCMLGGYKVFGSGAYAQVQINLPKGKYLICFDWIKGDSWDYEKAQFYFNGNLVWEKQYWGRSGTQVCGSTSSGWNELKETICVTVDHPGGTATLKWTSTLDQSASDEWWGVDNIRIYKAVAYDSSGKENHGTIYGAKPIRELLGYALEFDGKDDYIEIPDTDKDFLPSKLTVLTFIKTLSNVSWQCITERGGPTQVGWHFYINSGDHLYTNLGGEYFHSQPHTITLNRWYFVGFVWDGSKVTHYVNGKPVGTKPISSLYPYGDRLYIGIRYGWKYPFKGLIDEVRVYNKALPNSVIQDLFYRIHLIVYNSGSYPVNLNGTSYSIEDLNGKTICVNQMIYNETFITESGKPYILPGKQDIVKVSFLNCHLERNKKYRICLIGKTKVCGEFEVI